MRLDKLLFPMAFSICGSLSGACAPMVSGEVAVATPAYAGPSLSYVAPGVEVVTDADAAVFFYDNFYWYWDGGLWYRSARFGGERVVVREAPRALLQIREPGRYVHYRAPEHMRRPMPEPDRQAWVRDHRGGHL